MIKEEKTYTIICDRCGDDLNKDDLPFMLSIDENEEFAKAIGWKKEGNKHYCPDCIEAIEDEWISHCS